jgi:hypothetical protein
MQQIERLEWRGSIDWERVRTALDESTGRPTVIGYRDDNTLTAMAPP